MTTIAVADASAMLRAGARAALERDGSCCVAEAATLEDLVAVVVAEKPALAVIDLALPPLGGIAALERVRRLGGPRTIVWSFDPSARDVLSAISAGAVGYVTKEISSDELVAAVRAVQAGDAVLSTHLTGLLVAAVQRDRGAQVARESLLSARERRVLDLVSTGMRNRDIAAELEISEFTVKRHVQNILRKLELPSRRAAVARYGDASRGQAVA